MSIKVREGVVWVTLPELGGLEGQCVSQRSRDLSDFFMKALNEHYDALHVPRARRINWITLARDRNAWGRCWRLVD